MHGQSKRETRPRRVWRRLHIVHSVHAVRPVHSLAGWLALLLGALSVAPAATLSPPRRFEFARLEMGTLFRVALYSSDPTQARVASERAFAKIAELDGIFSDYRPDSELSRVCNDAAGQPQVVSRELFHLLQVSVALSRRTGGRFDVTVKPLSDLWRRARREGKLPAREDLEAHRQLVGYRDLLLNPWTRSVRFRKAGMRLDLGAIAKGYAADEALRVLREAGIERALVEAGGDVRTGLPPPGRKGWTVAIQPGQRGRLLLSDQAVATSGDDYQFLEIGGLRYSHILDPATGLGLTTHRLVTVVAPDATSADSLATALSVCDIARGLQLVEETEGAAARIESGDQGRVWFSSRFPH